MRGWNFGLAVATLLLSAGATKTLASADDACDGDSCNGPEDQSRARTHGELYSTSAVLAFIDPLNDADGDGEADYEASEFPVATAYAAPVIATQDTCMGSTSFGAQGMRFGMSVGTVWQDDNCRRIKNARQLRAMGYPRAAVQLLCIDEEVRAAMLAAGTPCPIDERFIPVVAEVAPPPAPAPEPSRADVHFDFDSAKLTPQSIAALEQMAASLQARGISSVEIEGHADAVGADAYNLALSARRAQAVADWFTAHGVAATLVKLEAKGEAEPVASNATPAGRALNRRVEVLVR